MTASGQVGEVHVDHLIQQTVHDDTMITALQPLLVLPLPWPADH